VPRGGPGKAEEEIGLTQADANAARRRLDVAQPTVDPADGRYAWPGWMRPVS
jgi:hypothetical protein